MAQALLMVSATSLVAYVVTFVLGVFLSLGALAWRHFLLAIPVTMLVVFSHAMVMFYLIGVSTRVKDVLKETGIAGAYRQEVRELHNELFPPATFAILATMATFVLGGGADTRSIHPLVHGAAGLAGLFLNGWAVFVTFDTVTRSVDILNRLGQEVDQEAMKAARPAT